MAANVGDRMILKESGEIVVLDQVIRRPKETEDRVPQERIHVEVAPPSLETWYKVHGLKSGSTIFRPADAFALESEGESDGDGVELKM